MNAPSSSAARRKKVAVVTGASSGIGRAAAIALARAGHDLVLAARGEDGLQTAAEACRQEGATVLVVPTDVSEAGAVAALAAAAIASFGAVDVWVNDAAVGAVGAFDETPMAAHEQIIRTDLLGYMYGAHAILPHFKGRGEGVLINVLSLGSWTPSPYASAYSAAKFGLRGFSNALRGELSGFPGIHVCDVHPSFVDTPGMQHGANYVGAKLKPPPGVVPVQAVADAIVRLAKRPRRQVVVGRGVTAAARTAFGVAPSMTMWSMARLLEFYFKVGKRAPMGDGNLFTPIGPNQSAGGWKRPGLRVAAGLVGGAAVAAVSVLALQGRSRPPRGFARLGR